MAKARTLVGLDVHAAKVVAAILDSETGELRFQRLGGESGPVVGLCRSLPAPVRVTYEAGPTGYGLARGLLGAEIDCLVAAPGKIPRGATERVKTDRRDAEHLVRLLMAGKLSPVRVPGPPEEAMRDVYPPSAPNEPLQVLTIVTEAGGVAVVPNSVNGGVRQSRCAVNPIN